MKSLDVVVLCKILLLQKKGIHNWTYARLADEVCLSVGETHASVKRLRQARLFDSLSRTAIIPAVREFLVHGVKYAFQTDIGTLERGVATSHSAPVLGNEFHQLSDDSYVWPYAKGRDRGLSVTPLSRNAPKAALKDPGLYDLLALIDALRVGRARERELAENRINDLVEAV